MEIVWDYSKDRRLQDERGISFQEIAEEIVKGNVLDILENPTRENQKYLVLRIRQYTWSVPFLYDDQNRMVLKTAFPNRKLHRVYGEYDDEVSE